MSPKLKTARLCLEVIGPVSVTATATAAAANDRQPDSATVTPPSQGQIVSGTVMLDV